MANYGNGSRFTRPPFNERPAPRFNPPMNRHSPRNNFNDNRPPPNKPVNPSQSVRPEKPTHEASISSPSTSNSPSVRNQPAAAAAAAASNSSSTDVKASSSGSTSIAAAPYLALEPSTRAVDNKPDVKLLNEQQRSTGQKRARPAQESPAAPQPSASFDSSTGSLSQQQLNDRKTTQGGRCRLFIGNVPSDLTQDEFQLLFGKYGELIEYFVNPSRGFGFIKLSSRQLAEQAKADLDSYVLRGKPLRIRFASQGATVKVKNLSCNVSNELLKEAFEQYFGVVERAVVVVDDRGKSTGEGIIEFEKKPSAQKCLNECTERCFFISSELRPVIVEPWDIKDEEDGLPEKSLVRNAVYVKERESRPRFAEVNTIEHTVGLKWKELELQEKQLLEEVKKRMQYATEQVQVEIDQMYLEHQSQVLREELLRRQEDLRRIDELRSQELDRRRQMIPMHHHDAYNDPFHMPAGSMNNAFHQNQAAGLQQYNEFPANAYANPNPHMQAGAPIDAAYATNQAARGYGFGNARPNGDEFLQQQHQQQGFERKRPRF